MKVLVTGDAGFIASHVMNVLIEAGHRVCVVDDLRERGGGKLENLNPQAAFTKSTSARRPYPKFFKKRNRKSSVIWQLNFPVP